MISIISRSNHFFGFLNLIFNPCLNCSIRNNLIYFVTSGLTTKFVCRNCLSTLISQLCSEHFILWLVSDLWFMVIFYVHRTKRNLGRKWLIKWLPPLTTEWMRCLLCLKSEAFSGTYSASQNPSPIHVYHPWTHQLLCRLFRGLV